MYAGTEPEKSLGGTGLNCCSIKAHFTLYYIHFKLGETIVGFHGIRSGRGGSSPARPTAGSVPGCMDLIVVGYDINFDMTRLQSADTYRRETPNEQTVMNTSLLAACCSLDVSSFAEKRLPLQNTISRSRLLPVPKPMLITCLLQT
jgi:hypothetical protein